MPLLKSLFQREGDFRPDRDWRFLFGSFLVLAVASFVAAVYFYRVLNTLEVVSQERMAPNSSARLDRAALDRAIKALAEKQTRFETFLTTPPTIVDPAR